MPRKGRIIRAWVYYGKVKQRNAERTAADPVIGTFSDPDRKLDVVVHAPLSTVCC